MKTKFMTYLISAAFLLSASPAFATYTKCPDGSTVHKSTKCPTVKPPEPTPETKPNWWQQQQQTQTQNQGQGQTQTANGGSVNNSGNFNGTVKGGTSSAQGGSVTGSGNSTNVLGQATNVGIGDVGSTSSVGNVSSGSKSSSTGGSVGNVSSTANGGTGGSVGNVGSSSGGNTLSNGSNSTSDSYSGGNTLSNGSASNSGGNTIGTTVDTSDRSVTNIDARENTIFIPTIQTAAPVIVAGGNIIVEKGQCGPLQSVQTQQVNGTYVGVFKRSDIALGQDDRLGAYVNPRTGVQEDYRYVKDAQGVTHIMGHQPVTYAAVLGVAASRSITLGGGSGSDWGQAGASSNSSMQRMVFRVHLADCELGTVQPVRVQEVPIKKISR